MPSKILITGSSGYVCSYLIPLIRKRFEVTSIDVVDGIDTDIVSDIGADNLRDMLNFNEDYVVIHCAAARFDYGIQAGVYLNENVTKTRAFLNTLKALNVSQFIHVSSVAAIDGKKINYQDDLACDDAYRATKYLQQCEVTHWCKENNVPLKVVLPSAIYDDIPRADTNIGKLQKITRFFPILPRIQVKKSLTYLPKFCSFIEQIIGQPGSAVYLTIEKPVQTVTETMKEQSGRHILTLPIPGLKVIVYALAWLSWGLGSFLRRDPILLPSRVAKLFSDTSYSNIDDRIDCESYNRTQR